MCRWLGAPVFIPSTKSAWVEGFWLSYRSRLPTQCRPHLREEEGWQPHKRLQSIQYSQKHLDQLGESPTFTLVRGVETKFRTQISNFPSLNQ